jgi:hypothetical protein
MFRAPRSIAGLFSLLVIVAAYSPHVNSQTFAATGSLSEARYLHTATMLN